MKKTERKEKQEKPLAETLKSDQHKEKKELKLVEIPCNDKNCPIHGNLKTRGRIFEGKIIKKFQKRVTIEFERMVYVRKYERYKKSKTKIHARVSDCIEGQIKKGDLIRIQECRPLSKIVHFAVIKKIKDAEENVGEKIK
ncbi:MAG: 30S ribosomal protein S17 [archaeon]